MTLFATFDGSRRNPGDLSAAAAKMDRHLSSLGKLSGIPTEGEEEKRTAKPISPLQ
jgi:hypothetical protein